MDNSHCCPKSYGCTSNAPTWHIARACEITRAVGQQRVAAEDRLAVIAVLRSHIGLARCKAVHENAANCRAVATRTVRAHGGVIDEAQCGDLQIGGHVASARFNLVDKAWSADDYDVLGVRASIRREIQANTRFANAYIRRNTEAVCPVLERCGVTHAVAGVTRVFGTGVTIVAQIREDTGPVPVIARITGACYAIVANDAFAGAFFAPTVYAHAATAIEGASSSVLRPAMATSDRLTPGARAAGVRCAFVAVVAVFVAIARGHGEVDVTPHHAQSPQREQEQHQNN
jgi:hypothetical protein